MVELIIEESGFPMGRPELTELQGSFKVPIDEVISMLPGIRVLSGVIETDNGDGTITITEGYMAWEGKIYTFEGYTGPVQVGISLFTEVSQLSFNIGTEANPIYENRDAKVYRAVRNGNLAGNEGFIKWTSVTRGRKFMEYLTNGSTTMGLFFSSTSETVLEVVFQEIDTSDYIVLGNFRPMDPNAPFLESFNWTAKNRTTTGFQVIVSDVGSYTPVLVFDWALLVINRSVNVL